MALLQLKFTPPAGDFPNTLELPRSKSIAARALILRYITGNRTRIAGIPQCDDSRDLLSALRHLSEIVPSLPERLSEDDPAELYGEFNLGLGGTSLRFFTGLAASVPALRSDIDCAPPLRRRPFRQLAESLAEAGAEISYTAVDGYPPMTIEGRRLEGGALEVPGNVSSQFASSLMLSSPAWRNGLQLHLTGENLVSLPYLVMTAQVMAAFNLKAGVDGRVITVAPGIPEPPAEYAVEADWSAASYFYEAALLCPGRKLRIACLTPPDKSIQGDSRCGEIFGFLGVDTEYPDDGSAILSGDAAKIDALRKSGQVIELDMNATPDLVPAVAVGMCLAGLKFRFSGIGHLRHKESDRIMTVQTELEKIGYRLESGDDWMAWEGARMPVGEGETIATYHDHRIAMSFAVAACRLPYIYIEDPEVVDKSFQDFWNQMRRLGMEEHLIKK